MTTTYRFDRFEFRRDTLLWGALLVNTYLLLVFIYHVVSPNRITSVTPVLVPLVWLAVGLWAIVRTRPPVASRRQRIVAMAIAVAYFGLLGFFGGLWGFGVADHPTSFRLAVTSLPPGWSPAVLANTPWVRVSLLPFKVVGYLALGYLLYAALLDAAGSAISGVLGLLSCVSCTWPIVAAVATSVVGGSGAVADAALSQSYPVSTVVFVVTVALLYWRPGWR